VRKHEVLADPVKAIEGKLPVKEQIEQSEPLVAEIELARQEYDGIWPYPNNHRYELLKPLNCRSKQQQMLFAETAPFCSFLSASSKGVDLDETCHFNWVDTLMWMKRHEMPDHQPEWPACCFEAGQRRTTLTTLIWLPPLDDHHDFGVDAGHMPFQWCHGRNHQHVRLCLSVTMSGIQRTLCRTMGGFSHAATQIAAVGRFSLIGGRDEILPEVCGAAPIRRGRDRALTQE
jgi:hypothetical protein